MTPEEAEERECIAEDRAKGKKEDDLIESMEKAYENIEIELTHQEQYALIVASYDIDPSLLKEIQKQGLSHEETITALVLSDAIGKILTERVNNYED